MMIDRDAYPARYWRRAEVDLLIRLIDDGYNYDAIARRLKRTPVAVRIKAKRLSHRLLRTRSALGARGAQRLLGLACAKTVTLWIAGYGLKARNGGKPKRPLWRIQWLDLMAWLEDPRHWMAYNPARVTEPALREHLTEIRQGQPRWLAVGEVARRYCVTVGTVHQWRVKGFLSMTRYGNWWVRESDIEGWVQPCERSKAGIPRYAGRVVTGLDRIVAAPSSQPR